MNEEQNTAPQNPNNQINPQQTNPIQQPTVTPIQNVGFQQPTQQHSVPNGQPAEASSADIQNIKKKPPIAAQILYALAFIGLIFGLLGSVVLLISSSDSDGIFGTYGVLLGVISATITILGFYLIHEIRYGKKWALIAYTTLFLIGLVGTAIDIATAGNLDSSSVLVQIILTPILLILWTKNRSYFNKV